MSYRAVKVFGERNVGTNALARLIADNSRSHLLPSTEYMIDENASRQAWSVKEPRERERLLDEIFADVPPTSAWKHRATTFEDPAAFEGTLVLFVVKHPASWLTSLFKNPYHALRPIPASIEDFFDYEWETGSREGLNGNTYHPLNLYEAKIRSYLRFSGILQSNGLPFAFIRQEDLLLDQKKVFELLAPQLLEPAGRFRMRHRSAKNGFMPLFFVSRFYSMKKWKESLSGLEEILNAGFDWSLVADFDYRPI